MIIDVHNHIGESRDGGVGSLNKLLENLESARIDRAVLFPIDDGKGIKSYPEMNDEVLAAQQAHPDKITAFCRVAAGDGQAAISELNRCIESGHQGLKLHPRSDRFEPDQALGLFEAAKRLSIPILLHTGHLGQGHPVSWAPLIERFPTVPVTLAHGGKDAYRELAKAYKDMNHVYVETSCLSFYRTRFLIEALGYERLIFGSDYPYSHPEIELLKLKLLLPEAKKQRKVFYDNALCFLEG